VQIPTESDQYQDIFSDFLKLSKKYFKKMLRKTPYNLGTYQFAKDAPLQAKILTDEIELNTTNPDEEFSFEDYSNAIVSIIDGSQQKLCVGIYGFDIICQNQGNSPCSIKTRFVLVTIC